MAETSKIISSVCCNGTTSSPAHIKQQHLREPTLQAQLECLKLKNGPGDFNITNTTGLHRSASSEREFELLRGDSPLTIDSSLCVDDDGEYSNEESDRALFSPTTDEDKTANERRQQKERQRKLSFAAASSEENAPSSTSSKFSLGPDNAESEEGGESKDNNSKTETNEAASAAHAMVALPYYTEPDWSFAHCDGFYYKSYKGTYLYPMYTPEVMAPIEAFQARDDDIVLCSFMKTGTTWLQSIILAMLYAERDPNILTRGEAHQLSPCLERMEDATAADTRSGLQMIDELPKDLPRFYQTHLPWRAMPAAIEKNNKLRLIYVTRNPKDTAVSWYYFLRHARERIGEDVVPHVSVQQFGRQIMGQTPQPFGPFMKHIEEFWELSKHKRSNILFLTYEQLQQRYVETVQQVAKFLGKNFSAEKIIQIAKSCRLDSLKALEVNQRDSQICALHTTSFFRKGQTGTWKEHFTVAFNEEMDEWLQNEGQKSDFRFEFV